jgi:hypothetical protein
MIKRTLTFVAVLVTAITPGIAAQGIVVDEGQFNIRIDGRDAGTEDFVIRRAGLGRSDAVFARATVSVTDGGVLQEVRPLLQATPLEGAAASYEVVVTGQDAMEVRLARVLNARSRYVYVATIRSDIGSEDREFQARENTRVIELGVAHHYYFLRDVREGRETPVLEPRSRRQIKLTAGSRTEEELVLGPNHISARRVEYTSDSGDDRVVWYDRQGRVLRVEVPSLSYVAERTDLVG